MASDGPKEDDRNRSRERDRRRNDTDGGFSFTLPPIKLPNVAFPSDIQIRLPPPGHRWESDLDARNVLVVAILVDLVDAALLFVVGTPIFAWMRVVGGTGLSLVLVGLPGLLYAWEGVAVLAGVQWLTLFPSATALALVRTLR